MAQEPKTLSGPKVRLPCSLANKVKIELVLTRARVFSCLFLLRFPVTYFPPVGRPDLPPPASFALIDKNKHILNLAYLFLSNDACSWAARVVPKGVAALLERRDLKHVHPHPVAAFL